MVRYIANKNMIMVRKLELSILKLLDFGKKMSFKLKRFSINYKSDNYISKIMTCLNIRNFTYILIKFSGFITFI